MEAARPHRVRRPSFLGAVSTLLVVGGLLALAVLLHVPARVAVASEQGLGALFAPTTEASYGDTLQLTGATNDAPVEVTTATPRLVDASAQVTRGNVLVGAQVSIRNLGEVSWSSGQGLEIHAVDSRGASYDVRREVPGARALRLPASVLPGRTVKGLLVFEVPSSARITSVTVKLGDGMSRTGEWTSGG